MLFLRTVVGFSTWLTLTALGQAQGGSDPGSKVPDSRPSASSTSGSGWTDPTSTAAQRQPTARAAKAVNTAPVTTDGSADVVADVVVDALASTGVFDGISPTLALAGGFDYEALIPRKGEGLNDKRQNRLTTLAMTRFGFRGDIFEHLYVESEVEINLGRHGTSVWEGQIAMQVRNQFLRLHYNGVSVEVGRVTDASSTDFLSVHNLNLMGMDPFVRNQLLVSGFNRGNGVGARYELLEGLTANFYFNAANPVSMTGTAMVGGRFAPFSRFYLQPNSSVGRDANSYPTDSFHMMIATPSLTYRSDRLDANLALQMFEADTNMNSPDDETIQGWNARAGVRVKVPTEVGGFHPFINGTLLRNDLLDPDAPETVRLEEQFKGWSVMGGLDWEVEGGHGLGVQYAVVRDKHQVLKISNIAASYYVDPSTAVTLRYARWSKCIDDDCDAGGGSQSVFLTLRTMLY